jgi:hypothetical protein
LGLVLEACPDIADYARNGISSWRDLVATAATVRSIIGSSPSAWEDANTVLGLEDPAVLVAAIVQSGTAIQSAGGARGYDGNRIVLTGASLGTGVATATHEAAALVLESPYLSALDVASARYAIFPGHCHVRTTPADQGFFCSVAFDRGCGHVFGLLMWVMMPVGPDVVR